MSSSSLLKAKDSEDEAADRAVDVVPEEEGSPEATLRATQNQSLKFPSRMLASFLPWAGSKRKIPILPFLSFVVEHVPMMSKGKKGIKH